MQRLRDQRGQATIDYVALIALLAILVTVTASLTGFAPGIVNATLGQFRRALCIVRGGDCPVMALQPCTVASSRKADHISVSALIIRIDKDHVVLRERLSDGTVRLTVSESRSGGLTLGIGGHAELKLKGRTMGFVREANGAIQGVLGHGHVYLARNDHEADEFLDALHSGIRFGPGGIFHIGGHSPTPQSDFVEGGIRGLGHLGAGVKVAGVSLDGVADAMLGASRNRKTGQVTITLNAGLSGSGLLGAILLGKSSFGDRHARLLLTLDRHGAAQQLTLEASGIMTRGGTLPLELAKEAGTTLERSVAAPSSDLTGRSWELAAQVDLRDPDAAAAWKAFRHHPTSPGAIRALGAILRDESQLSVSSYAVDSDAIGISAGIAFALKAGGEVGQTVDRARLLTASTRPPGGLWERRFDCRQA
jgi:hypothetical protein